MKKPELRELKNCSFFLGKLQHYYVDNMVSRANKGGSQDNSLQFYSKLICFMAIYSFPLQMMLNHIAHCFASRLGYWRYSQQALQAP